MEGLFTQWTVPGVLLACYFGLTGLGGSGKGPDQEPRAPVECIQQLHTT